MRYIEFRESIKKELRRHPEGCTWVELRNRLNLPYDSEEALDLAEKLGKFIRDIAWDESANLAEERGPFPE